MAALIPASCPTSIHATQPTAAHLHILAAAERLQRQVVALQGLNDCVVDAHLAHVGALVGRKGQAHGLPRLLNLVQGLQGAVGR